MMASDMAHIVDSLGALSRSMPVSLDCCGHEEAAHARLCGECGSELLHGHYCERCRRRTQVALACPGQRQRMAARLAADYQRVQLDRERGYAGC